MLSGPEVQGVHGDTFVSWYKKSNVGCRTVPYGLCPPPPGSLQTWVTSVACQLLLLLVIVWGANWATRTQPVQDVNTSGVCTPGAGGLIWAACIGATRAKQNTTARARTAGR